jgi:hypothetical protein
VLDANENLVEVQLSYDKQTNTLKVVPTQPYKSGETYTLYIGKDIEGENGFSLKHAVKVEFTVE